MNRFVYLINNRTGCKVRCINPVFQHKLGLLIKKLKKYENELKQNKISKELLLKIRKTLNETLSLLGINNKSSKSLSRSSTDSTDDCGQIITNFLNTLISYLQDIYKCDQIANKDYGIGCQGPSSGTITNLIDDLKDVVEECLYININ